MCKVNGHRVHGITFKTAYFFRFDRSYTQFKRAKTIKFCNILWKEERTKEVRRTLTFSKSTVTNWNPGIYTHSAEICDNPLRGFCQAREWV
jgi:hypothetical protein